MKSEEIRIKLPRPTPVQQKILNKASRYNAVAMGEKAGKTTLGIEAGYFDLLNVGWPRFRYTPEFAPGIKYFG